MEARKNNISQAKLKELLHYDPETGVFTWLVSPTASVKIGDRAGSATKRGYRQIGIFGKLYLEHRLAWLYVHGTLPRTVDHDNGDTAANWIKNLRPATVSQSQSNKARYVNNTSGFKGVTYSKNTGKWFARISVNRKRKHLGSFDTAELAHEFYCLASDMLFGEFSNHGVHKCQKST